METDNVKQQRGGVRAFIRTVVFLLLVAAIVAFCNTLFTPYQSGTHTKETIRGMYLQPDNSIQVVFLGASNMLSAASPMDLYEQLGVNGYNGASSVQPPLISYGILKDLLRTQSKTLKTVVLDPSIILRNTAAGNKPAWAERVIVNMQDSPVKLGTILDFTADYDGIVLAEQLIPTLKYHVRWNALVDEDFDLLNDVSDTSYSHGEFIRYRANMESDPNKYTVDTKNSKITEKRDYDEAELEAIWNARSKKYLDKIVALCEENNLDLLFVKTPNAKWNNKFHDSIALLAEQYGVDFLDLSKPEILAKCDITYAVDFVDEKHPNIHGSEKITRYIGQYLIDRFGEWEHIDYSAFPSVQADLDKYLQCRDDGKLLLCQNFEEYLELIDQDRYTVFVSTKGNVSSKDMSKTMRKRLNDLGFSGLASLEEGSGYIGVSDAGTVLVDKCGNGGGVEISASGTYKNGEASLDRADTPKDSFTVISAEGRAKPSASILIGEKERCENKAGINFVVYNRDTQELIDTSSFNPSAGFARSSDQLNK